VEIRDTRYARAPDGAYIAFQTTGDEPIDLAWQFDWLGNVDLIWEAPSLGKLFRALSRFSRLILHDRRATGLSSRNFPAPNLETRVSDLGCVLDAVGSTRPVLGGERDGGAPNALLAATTPERIRSLVWYVPQARSVWTPDYPWGAPPEYMELDERALEHWGTAGYGRAFVDQEASGGHNIAEEAEPIISLLSRHMMTPDVATELARIWSETDIRDVLRSVRVPTLLITHESPSDGAAEAQHIASLMPNSTLKVIPGEEETADEVELADVIRQFIGADRPVDLGTMLTTVLFTDIVGSSEKQAAVGDRGWKDLVERHHSLVRAILERWGGVENDTAGDGFYATFNGPARAIRCALEVAERVRDIGIEIRAGVHTGECEIVDGKAAGIAVTKGSRISSLAGPSQVLVSQTVKDLVAGSGLAFEDAGEHDLKGVPDRWWLYSVVPD
jgi:class 3 adenylate cyclase